MSTPASPASATALSPLDRFFHITERGSTMAREIRGGIVTFFTMSYILVLNPLILSAEHEGIAPLGTTQQIAAGTALVACVMTILMGVVANYPMALAAGLGINAMVAYTLVGMNGMTYADAMGLVVIEGIIILLLVLTGFREAVFKAVPTYLKTAISVGIGLFIALIGLVDAKVVRPGGTPLELGLGGSLQGWPVLVFLFGLFLILVLHVRRVKGAILIGIVSSTVLAVILEAVLQLGTFNDDPQRGPVNLTGWALSRPYLEGSPIELPSLATLGQFNLLGSIEKVGIVSMVLLVFSLMLADFFDTMGTMVAVGAEGELLDEEGNPPRTREILVVDSLAAMAGGAGGVSSNTSYVESAAGVGEGARTGLASVVTGLMFGLSMFIAPVVSMVPYEAATPALVVVGFLMMMQVTDIDWSSPEIALPAFLTIIMMPFSYSITNGIGAGIIAYLVIQVATGGVKRVHPLMWLAGALFIVYFTLTPIKAILGVA
nr:NCS2 family permease [Actinomyces slackii]